MHLVYYDESGDDGLLSGTSPLFVLTAVYMHKLRWKGNYERIYNFRKLIKDKYGLPVKIEMHTKYFLLNKDPYRVFNFSNEARFQIMEEFINFVATLNLKVINTVIIKERIKTPAYNVLDTALEYSVQRIERDIQSRNCPEERFLIITDSGRVGKMRETTRRMQRFNYIPSHFGGMPYRNEIKLLLEDPLPKDSKESSFIQLADFISYLVALYSLIILHKKLPNRMLELVDENVICKWMEILKAVFNIRATKQNEYGIVYHPL